MYPEDNLFIPIPELPPLVEPQDDLIFLESESRFVPVRSKGKSVPSVKPKGKDYTIYLAASWGDLDRVQELANGWFSPIDKPDQVGRNFLHHAAAGDRANIIQWAYKYYEHEPKKRIDLFNARTSQKSISPGKTPFEIAFFTKSFLAVKALLQLNRQCQYISVDRDLLTSILYLDERALYMEENLRLYKTSTLEPSKLQLSNLQLLADNNLIEEVPHSVLQVLLLKAAENSDLQHAQLLMQHVSELSFKEAAMKAAERLDLDMLKCLLVNLKDYNSPASAILLSVINYQQGFLEKRLQIIRYLIEEKKVYLFPTSESDCLHAALAPNCPIAILEYLMKQMPQVVTRECEQGINGVSLTACFKSYPAVSIASWLENIKQKLPFFLPALSTSKNFIGTSISYYYLKRWKEVTAQDIPQYIEILQTMLQATINPKNASTYSDLLLQCIEIALNPNVSITFLQYLITLAPEVLEKQRNVTALHSLFIHHTIAMPEIWLRNIKEKLPYILNSKITLLETSASHGNKHALALYLDRWEAMSEQQQPEYFEYLETMLKAAMNSGNEAAYHDVLFSYIDMYVDQKKYKLAKFLHKFGVPINGSIYFDKIYMSLLHKAVFTNNFDNVRFLVKELKADLFICVDTHRQSVVPVKSGTPFSIVVLDSNFEMVKFFIKELEFPISTSDELGNTALHLTALHNLVGMARFLIDECGADVHAENKKLKKPYDLTTSSDMRTLFLTYMNVLSSPKQLETRPVPDQKILLPVQEINYSKLTFDKKLGSGTFGTVYKGRWSNTDVAIKKLSNDQFSHGGVEEFKKEVTIMANLNHPHVVTFYGAVFDPACIVMEYMAMGSLEDFLHDPKNEISINLQEQISEDIAIGLDYLHNKNIIHRDLTSANVLLDNNCRAKISDFGLSKIKQDTTRSKTQSTAVLGTIVYLPPEMLKKGAKHTYKSDVWSLGITLWEIVSREKPFQNEEIPAIVMQLTNEEKPLDIPESCSPLMSEIITMCWKKKVEERPDAKRIISFFEEMRRTQKQNSYPSNSNSLTTLLEEVRYPTNSGSFS